MQKNKALHFSILAAFLVCSAFSVVAAQDEIPPTAPSVDPEAEEKAFETPMNDDGNQPSPTFNPDAPTSSEDDPILYITGSNSTMPDGAEPYIGDAELLAANNTGNQSSPVFTAVGIAGAIGVGGAIAIFYFRKTKAAKKSA